MNKYFYTYIHKIVLIKKKYEKGVKIILI